MTPDPARSRETFTRFERARIIGARALQVSSGAPILIETDAEEAIDPIRVAQREFDEGVIPITVLRLQKQPANA